jgi:DNA-binding transcriptional ArsR family regulator
MTDLEIDGRRPRREFQKTRAEILSHPLRVRMLEIANEVDVSAVSFVRGGYAKGLLDHLEEGVAVSQVAYHFRKLLKAGGVEVIEHHYRRGAVENVYRGVARASFTAEEWKSLDKEQREKVSGVVMQALMARAESAMLEGTFDARDDRWLAWIQMALDEQGWEEICALCTRMMDDVERVREAAEERVGRTDEPAPTTPFTWGMMSFESPRS